MPGRTGKLVLRLARRQIFKAGDEQAGILAVDHRNRTRLSFVPIFFRDNGAMPALMVELNGDFRCPY